MARRKRKKRNTGLRQGRVALLILGLLTFWTLAYAVGALLGGGAPEYRPDQPKAPRYVGTAPFTVAVDAGHGGGDVGAVGFVQECEMTAATADALMALLEADPNFIPVTTRDSYQTAATTAQRAEAANRAGAQLFLSIHGNAAEDPAAQGFECYPVPPGRQRHSQSAAFARMLADEMSAAGHTLRGDGGLRYAYYDGEEKIITEFGGSDLPTFGVLEHTACPAVLAEQCFVTNEADVVAFGSDEGVKAAARCYYRAICAYFDLEPAELVCL